MTDGRWVSHSMGINCETFGAKFEKYNFIIDFTTVCYTGIIPLSIESIVHDSMDCSIVPRYYSRPRSYHLIVSGGETTFKILSSPQSRK